MSLKVRRLKRVEEFMQFGCLIGKQNLSVSYFYSGECYGFFVDHELKAGYCIMHLALDDMDLIRQIPKEHRGHLIHEDPFKYAEVTGYFIKDKQIRFRFYQHMLIKMLRHKASFFVYSYLTNNLSIEMPLRVGEPLRLYSGKPCLSTSLPASINVELMSKVGIIKICLNHILTKIKALICSK